MKVIYQHVTDPCSVVMQPGGTLSDTHIILGGATYGRFLFKHDPAVIAYEHCTIRDNVIEIRS